MIVSHLNLRQKIAFQYHSIYFPFPYILCPSYSRLGSAKCGLILFYLETGMETQYECMKTSIWKM
jgi:hypothetical protein